MVPNADPHREGAIRMKHCGENEEHLFLVIGSILSSTPWKVL